MISRRSALLGAVGVAVGRKAPALPRLVRGRIDYIITAEGSFRSQEPLLANLYPNHLRDLMAQLAPLSAENAMAIAACINAALATMSVRFVETPS